MKKIFVVLGLLLCLAGCGVPAKESGGGGSSGISVPNLLIPSAYVTLDGVQKDSSGALRETLVRKVDATHQDRIYEQIRASKFKTVYTWFDNGKVQHEYFDWSATTNSWVSQGYVFTDSYVFDQYGNLSEYNYVKNSTYNYSLNYTYPGYTGTGDISVKNIVQTDYISGTIISTENYTVTYHRSSDGLKVTENYTGTLINDLTDQYCYTVIY